MTVKDFFKAISEQPKKEKKATPDEVEMMVKPAEKKYVYREESLNESKQIDITVPFPIIVSPIGRVKATDAKKVLKHLSDNNLLKVGTDYFIKDSSGGQTTWYFTKSPYGIHDYELSCEMIGSYEKNGEDVEYDYFNGLYFDKERGKFTNFEWDSHKV